MKNIIKYAWSKRSRLWQRRGLIAREAGRLLIRCQYRLAGWLANVFPQLGLAGRVGVVSAHGLRHDLLQAVNPFIESEIGRLGLASAPIATRIRETYAQCNEDVIIEALLRSIFVGEGRSMSTLRYLEVGGNHPVQTSSSYLLYRAWGAHGWIVEANCDLAERLRKTRPRDTIIETAVSDKHDATLSFHVHELDELSSLSPESIKGVESTGLLGEVARVETVPNMHINALFETYIKDSLDFMSIDIEGLDLPVLQALSPAYRPTVLQVECVDPALLCQLKQTLEPRGYRLAAMTDVNVIFVQQP
jgi:FkbM family methyltransferase